MKRAQAWHCGPVRYTFSPTDVLVMGILNVTPDSFSDGGTHEGVEAALSWARRLRDEGADIIDVGGESTRPGFDEMGVSLEEEQRRVLPVVDALVKDGFKVSVDTSKPEIMRAVADLGAIIINDIRGFTVPGALEAAAATDLGLVVMHRSLTTDYEDLIGDVTRFLETQTERLLKLKVNPERICWDPGFGFGKTPEQNMALVKATDQFCASDFPFLMGLSRKSTLGKITGVAAPQDRVVSSVTGALLSAQRGAHVLRVHDVAPTLEALRVWQSLEQGRVIDRLA